MVPTPLLLATDYTPAASLFAFGVGVVGSLIYIPMILFVRWMAVPSEDQRHVDAAGRPIQPAKRRFGSEVGWTVAIVWGFLFPAVAAMVAEVCEDPAVAVILTLISAGVLFAATRSWIPTLGAVVGTGLLAAFGAEPDACFAPIFWNVVVGVSLIVWVEVSRARFRPRPGHCPACGYDLGGLPTTTCPECGPPPPAKASSSN